MTFITPDTVSESRPVNRLYADMVWDCSLLLFFLDLRSFFYLTSSLRSFFSAEGAALMLEVSPKVNAAASAIANIPLFIVVSCRIFFVKIK